MKTQKYVYRSSHGVVTVFQHQDRTERAQAVLDAYTQAVDRDDLDECLIELIADLQHWCKLRSSLFSFVEAFERAEPYFLEDTED